MTDRRDFLKSSLGAFCALNVPSFGFNVVASQKKKLDRIGLQLYTIRTELQKDFEKSIAKVAEIGYKELEFAGYYNRSPKDITRIINQHELDAVAAHISLEVLSTNLQEVVEGANTIGFRYVICPWLNVNEYSTMDSLKKLAETFNKTGEECKKAGIQFGYHNHYFEFQEVEGKLLYDVLLEETDPELVVMELDLFWIVRGDKNPLEYFKRYPGRFPLCHVKDMDEAEKMVDVGKGNIDFGQIFTQSEQAGLKHFFVEHDRPEDPFASIKASYEYLQGLEFG